MSQDRKFMDYIDGTLSQSEREAFENAMENDPSLSSNFKSYSNVVAIERSIAKESHKPQPNFSVNVMNAISAESGKSGFKFFKLLLGNNMFSSSSWRIPVAATATLLVCLVIVEKNSEQAANWRNSAPIAQTSVPVSPDMSGEEVARQPKIAEEAMVSQEVVLPKPHKAEPASDNSPLFLQDSSETNLPSSKSRAGDSATADKKADTANLMTDMAAPQPLVAKEVNKPIVNDDSPSKIGKPEAMVGLDSKTKSSEAKPAAPIAGGAAKMARSIPVDETREEYIGYAANNWLDVNSNPLSTISLDVDTGSYANVRRFLKDGRLPPPDAVRTEELINYFHYNYPQNKDRPFTVSYEIAPAPNEASTYLLKLGIRAKEIDSTSAAWNLVFLIDVSGSMSDQNKLPLLKRSLKVLVDKMRPQDRLSIVAYATTAQLVLPSTNGSEKNSILRAIDNLSAAGNTNGSGGIQLAYQIAAANRISGGVNRVILATDGDFNVGITNFDELMSFIAEKRASGTYLTTIGVGQGNLKEGLLEQLADKGNGNFFYVDAFNEARKIFEQDLLSNVAVVARDVKTQIEFNPKVVSSYRLVGHENRRLANQDFANDQVDAGEVGSGHNVTLMYELKLNTALQATESASTLRYQSAPVFSDKIVSPTQEIAFLKLRFKEPDNQASQELQFPLKYSELAKSIDATSADYRLAVAVKIFAQALRERRADLLDDALKLATGALANDQSGERSEFVELIRNAQAAMRPAKYDEPLRPYIVD